LSVGRTKLYELIGAGELPARKLGKKTLISAADLQAWADRLPALAVKPADHGEMKAACNLHDEAAGGGRQD
jgi:excisionase family DNA binding protein